MRKNKFQMVCQCEVSSAAIAVIDISDVAIPASPALQLVRAVASAMWTFLPSLHPI
jgi:hypothetical protein